MTASGGNVDSEDSPLPTVAEVIESLGIGLAQLRSGILGGSIWLADGAELLLIGTVTRVVADEWGLSAWQRGTIVSVVFVGVLVGNMLSGLVGDYLGRRLPILASYASVSFFSLLSALTVDYWSLCGVRFLVGVSFGIGQPCCNALGSEITPTSWRIIMTGFGQFLFVLGEMYSALLIYIDDPQMGDLNWRMLFVVGAIPSLLAGCAAAFFLHESPLYLALHDYRPLAIDVLESMRRDNGCPASQSVEYRPPAKVERTSALGALRRQCSLIFGPHLCFTTVVVIYSCFVLNALIYGCLYAFPQILQEVNMGTEAAISLIVGCLWEIPGFVVGCAFGMYWPRKPVICLYLVLTPLSLLVFTYAAGLREAELVAHGSVQHEVMLLNMSYMGIKLSGSIGFIVVYMYSTEIYPTIARTSGTAACIAGGRLGAMLAPLAFEHFKTSTNDFRTFFYFMILLCLVNLALVVFLPFETFGKHLKDNVESMTPLSGSG